MTATLYDVLLLYMRTAKPESDYVRTLHGASHLYLRLHRNSIVLCLISALFASLRASEWKVNYAVLMEYRLVICLPRSSLWIISSCTFCIV